MTYFRQRSALNNNGKCKKNKIAETGDLLLISYQVARTVAE